MPRPRLLALTLALTLTTLVGQPAHLAQTVNVTTKNLSVLPLPEALGDSIYPNLGQAGLDVLHYDLSLNVDQPGTSGLRGTAVLTMTATRTLKVISLDFLGPTVLEVQWLGQSVTYQQDRRAGKLLVVPPRPLEAGQQATLRVRYAGRAGNLPEEGSALSVGWQAVAPLAWQPGANFSLSEPDGTRTFMPVNDHPSDTATFTTRITVPDDYVAAASGVQQEQQRVPGGRTFVFTQAQPIPAYALGILVNHFEQVISPGVPVGPGGRAVQRRDYFPPDTPQAVRLAYRQTGEMLRVLSDWYGPYPFDAYGSAIVTPRVPALETATLSTMPVASSYERVIVHELAHQWFGNLVVVGDWADVWLNEGFATYAELLWAEANHTDDGIVRGWYERVQARPTRPLVATRESQLFDLTAYLRGALALHAVRQQVGDAAFKAFLRAYVQAYAAQPTRTAILLSFTHQQLGPQAADTLRLWVQSPTLPPRP